MKAKLCLIAICAAIITCGCGPSKAQMELVKKIQNDVHASSCLVTTGFVTDAIKGKQKTIQLSFNGIPKASLNEQNTSICAYYFYKGDTAGPSTYDQIAVSVSDGSSSFKKAYTIEEIKLADSLLKYPVVKFFKWYTSDSVNALIDGRFPPDDLAKIKTVMLRNDSAYGKIDGGGFAGWQVSFITETKEPIMAIYTTAISGKYQADYLIGVIPTTKKISVVRLLDWPHLPQ